MTLFEIAFASYIVEQLSKQDRDYKEFQQATNNSLVLTNPNHRKALLEWLNKWGCRLKKEAFSEYGREILRWYKKHKGSTPNKNLLELQENELNFIDTIYNELRRVKGFNHTVVSKVLFAISPRTFPPWDGAIRKELRESVNDSYKDYLEYVQRILKGLEAECQNKGFRLTELSKKFRKPLPKLIDEYHWLTITKKILPPSKDTLQLWCVWEDTKEKRRFSR